MKDQIIKLYINAVYSDLPPNVFADRVLHLLSVSKRISDLTIKYHAICEACGEFSMEAEKIDKEILMLDDELASLYVCQLMANTSKNI